MVQTNYLVYYRNIGTRDLPYVVETQWSNQDVVPWAWLTNIKVSGKSKDLSIKHKHITEIDQFRPENGF